MARARRQVEVVTSSAPEMDGQIPSTPGKTVRISRMNRVVSRRLVPKVNRDLREGIWHLSESPSNPDAAKSELKKAETALKILLALLAFWVIYSRHITAHYSVPA